MSVNLSSLACLTCTNISGLTLPVIICDQESARDALSKHFWFTEVQQETGILCQCCWAKISDFHQFYCEIERVHKLPVHHLVNVKQELNVLEASPACKGIADDKDEIADVKSEDECGTPCDDDDDEDEEDVATQDKSDKESYVPKKEESSDQESVPSDGNDPDFKQEVSVPKSVRKKAPKRQNKTGKRVGRPVQGWQKNLKDEEFITKNINLECDTCGQKHDTFQDLQKHSMMEHEKQAYVFCCDRKFNRRPRLIDHIQFHLNPDQFKCDVCRKQFQHSEALKLHKDKVHTADEEKTLQCSMCPKTFSRKKFLNIHEKYHRKLEAKEWHCTVCDRYFAYESMLRTHHQSAHSKEFKYFCHVCAKGFQILSSYTSHVASHDEDSKKDRTPDERVQCAECGVWVFKKSLRRHSLRHTGSKTCEHCGQECRNEMSLRYHKAQHRKGAVSCSVCGKSFKRLIILKEHMASHTGEVLYHCDFCEKTFNSHANRAAHRKKMHPKEWLEDKMRKNPNLQQDPGQLPQECPEPDLPVMVDGTDLS